MAKEQFFVGVDLGGTKILAVLATESGAIVNRHRVPTPRDKGAKAVIETIAASVDGVLDKAGARRKHVPAVGVSIPGVTDPKAGLAVLTPNMGLSGVPVAKELGALLGAKVVLANDCNAGILGEAWLGSARAARSAAGIFVGTGIGGGFIRRDRIWRGFRNSAMEVGHMIVEVDGPECGCGNLGCFEALASRTAIERDLRAAVADGRSTVLSELLEDDLSMIRSGALKEALAREDALVTDVLARAGRMLGVGCLNIRHLLDPEVILLGGGVIEACSDFLLPIIQGVLDADKLPGSRPPVPVRIAALGDDAVALGLIAMAQRELGGEPLAKCIAEDLVYPEVRLADDQLIVGEKAYSRDVCILVGGKIGKRKKDTITLKRNVVTPRQVERLCVGGPEIVFLSTGVDGKGKVTDDAQRFLEQRAIECEILDTARTIDAYNTCHRRKAALFQVRG